MSDLDLKFIPDEAGDLRIVIVSRSDGFFHYRQDAFYRPIPEEGQRGGWVNQIAHSGIFHTAKSAEEDARQCVPWLRDQISN